MKRTLSLMTAALFAGALAVPAFAQDNPPPAAPAADAGAAAAPSGDAGMAKPEKHHHHGHHHKKSDTMGAEASPAASPAP